MPNLTEKRAPEGRTLCFGQRAGAHISQSPPPKGRQCVHIALIKTLLLPRFNSGLTFVLQYYIKL